MLSPGHLFAPSKRPARLALLALGLLQALAAQAWAATDYVRVNQVGYLSGDTKVAIAFANSSLSSLTFEVINASTSAVLWGPAVFPATAQAYAPFSDVYQLDFSSFQPAAAVPCMIKLSDGTLSPQFQVGPCVYGGTEEIPLNFFRAENCGPGNWYDAGANLGVACHTAPGTAGATGDEDGEVVDGPNAGTKINTEGAWHDSGDYIKFMITVAWVDEILLLSYQENPTAFVDQLGSNMQTGSNGVPDVLDEGRYGLAWILAMNPNATTLYDDVGDGRDHDNFGTYLPQNDGISYAVAAAPDTGTVPAPYRPVYGGPQDKGGTQNCARAAGALALGYQIWSAAGTGFQDTTFAATCLTHAEWLYALGKAQNAVVVDVDGFYPVSGFSADMELAAAQLYKATGTASYLSDAETYAAAAGSGGGELDWSSTNFIAHDSLFPLVPAAEQATLKGFMQSDLNANLALSNANPYGLGYSFVWGTLENSTSLVAKCQLWKKMYPADTTYDAMAVANRDFLLGRNPWGVCFIQGMGTTYPHYPQQNISMILYQKTPYGRGTASVNTAIPGLESEGPVDYNDYKSQGITLSGSDVYSAFDNATAGGWVYHDDNEDYTSNEPTTSGAVWAVNIFANLAASCSVAATPSPSLSPSRSASPTPSASPTASASPTPSPSRTASASPTASPSPTAGPSFTPSPSPTVSVSVTLTRTSTPSASPSPSDTRTASQTPTGTASASATPVFSVSASPSATPVFSVSASPSATPSSSASPSVAASLSPSATATLSATPSEAPSATGTGSVTPTEAPTAAPSATTSPGAGPSATTSPGPGAPASPISTASMTAAATCTASPTQAAGPATSATSSPTPADTATPGQAPATSGGGEGPLGISQACGLPNPNAREIAFAMGGAADRTELRIYSPALVLAAFAQGGPATAGWNRQPLPPEWAGLPNGTWFFTLQAFRGAAVSARAQGRLVLLR